MFSHCLKPRMKSSRGARPPSRSNARTSPNARLRGRRALSCTSKGKGRQGIGPFCKELLNVSTLRPVVILVNFWTSPECPPPRTESEVADHLPSSSPFPLSLLPLSLSPSLILCRRLRLLRALGGGAQQRENKIMRPRKNKQRGGRPRAPQPGLGRRGQGSDWYYY